MIRYTSRSVLTSTLIYFVIAFAWAFAWHTMVDYTVAHKFPHWSHLIDDIVFAFLTSVLLYFLLARDERRHREAEAVRRATDAERARLLEQLSQRHAELAAILQQMPVGIIVAEAASGAVVLQNEQVAALLGQPFAPGKAEREVWIDERCSPDGPDDVAQALIEQVAYTGEGMKDREVRFVRDRECAALLVSAVPIRDQDDCVTRVLATFHDITERQRAAEELRQARDEMELRVKARTAELALAYQLLEQRVDERTRELSTLLEVSRQVASSRELKSTLDLVLDQLEATIGFTAAAIFALQDDTLSVLSYRDPQNDQQVAAAKIPLALAPGLRAVCAGREPVLVSDLQDDSALSQLYRSNPAALTQELLGNSRSWLGVPMVVKDRQVGLLRLAHMDPNVFTAHHGRLTLALADQAAMAIENARLYRAAQLAAAMEERQRLARDLHDSVSQALFGIILGARSLAEMLGPTSDKISKTLNFVLAQAQTALNETRALIIELGPESVSRQGLVAALTEHLAKVEATSNLVIASSLCREPEMSLSAKETLYRVVQQALQNVLQHAGASQVQVTLSCTEREVVLNVADSGVGFNPDEVPPGHLGLKFMRERVANLGGSMEVDSAPGRGTSIRVRVPLPNRA